ncbi:Rpn family recombination-promoting nuclease/putative transposase [Pampinifervens florentissimum]|uniref:Rpn family recombination-promoting nuclease/putative transposase n=1 Tax=Pampinifervens florentissimum TaxID=1632019 RepID=UPI0013B486D9|nr:Rpn family recombination-promoting nuclease/putative transposase [Hydrogenobacter sp. T-8]QID33581.1 hypothetical protein G3M65_07270 [Hydrogenobacter sp. T-8]
MSSKDIALKDIFEEIPQRLSKILAPAPIKELLPTNFPSTELRVDFLARLEDESILHIEFQSFNDNNMPFRMLRYYLAIWERYPSNPIKQLLVYVGNRKLRMKSRLKLRNLTFSYEMIDIRQIDCRVLLESPDPMDRLLACLCKVEDEAYLIEKLIKTMEGMNEEERKDYLLKALTLTELRPNLRIRLTEEVRHMPIVVRPEDIKLPKRKLRKDILYRLGLEEGKHIGFQEGEVIGIEKGKQIGFQEGEIIGIEKGLLKSAQDMVVAIIEAKLGYVPEEIANRIREIKDVDFLRSLAKKLVSASEDFMQVLATELKIS